MILPSHLMYCKQEEISRIIAFIALGLGEQIQVAFGDIDKQALVGDRSCHAVNGRLALLLALLQLDLGNRLDQIRQKLIGRRNRQHGHANVHRRRILQAIQIPAYAS
jgi:hypothetical protein